MKTVVFTTVTRTLPLSCAILLTLKSSYCRGAVIICQDVAKREPSEDRNRHKLTVILFTRKQCLHKNAIILIEPRRTRLLGEKSPRGSSLEEV